ncbi:hypothetical protein [Rhodococcus sp. NPDC059234]|uniref:hypothetical protein n=1 Tax=Rhodococcus sp. NPDC059234 TaxID=3346781 RepID=UPI00366B012B
MTAPVPPEQGGNWQGAAQPPMDPIGNVDRQPPVDVLTAFQLLCGVAALGVVNLFASLAAVYGDRATYVDQLMRDLRAQDPTLNFSESTVDALMLVGLGVSALIGLAITALYLLFVYKMRRGRNWARMLVTMAGVLMVFLAVPTLFGLGAGGGAGAMVSGGAGILQAVLSVGAVVLMHRADSNRYFLPAVNGR